MHEQVNLTHCAITNHLRNFLNHVHYYLFFDEEANLLTLEGNNGTDVSQMILECRNASYADAVRLADVLGLQKEFPGARPTSWGTPIHFIRLEHDGSIAAESLYSALLRLQLPHKVIYGVHRIAIAYRADRYAVPEHSINKLIEMIERIAGKDPGQEDDMVRFMIS